MPQQRLSFLAGARLVAVVSVLAVAGCGGEGISSHYDGSTAGRAPEATGGNGGTGVGGSAGGAGGGSGGNGTGGELDAGTGGAGNNDGGADQMIDAAADQPALAGNGARCNTGVECQSTFCADNVCCNAGCGGTCYTCATGTCVPAANGIDPRNECTDRGGDSCGTDGVCNGAGACRLYAAGTSCPGTATCNATASAVVLTYACNGIGLCSPATQQDCNGFLCNSATCGTSCAIDGACAPGSFCSASSCFQQPVNLAGNGDLEYGTTAGWTFFSGGALSISNTAVTGGVAHAGQYSIGDAQRGQLYQGPSYALPTGPGKYTVTAWALQKDDLTLSSAFQLTLVCASSTNYLTVGSYGAALPQGGWTKFTGIVDSSTMPDCSPAATPPGVVKSATLYLNQTAAGSPVVMPDLFLDDLVVRVTDGHNLVGNPNFEAGVIDGWSINGTGTLAISTTIFNPGGLRSLAQAGRTTTTTGPRYALPLGTAKYNVLFHGLHTGTLPHSLSLMPAYTCLGGTQVIGTPIATAAGVAPNTWTLLSGTVTLPPATAAAGCRLTQAAVHMQQEAGTCGTGTGQIECPDLYVDDVAITLAP